MVVNAVLDALLDQKCTVFRPVQTRSAGVTKENLSANSTGVKCHIQIKPTEGTAREADMAYGQEETGDHWGFYNSTMGLQRGDLIKATDGPFSGKNFWLKGFVDDTDVEGIEHICVDLKFTPQSTGDIN